MFKSVRELLGRHPFPVQMLVEMRRGITIGADWARQRGKLSDSDEAVIKRYVDALDAIYEGQMSALEAVQETIKETYRSAQDAKAPPKELDPKEGKEIFPPKKGKK